MTDLPLTGRSILVIEDEAIIALEFSAALEQDGATVLMARSIKDALAHIGNGNVSAAIVDRVLTDGLCTPICEQLNARGIPFVMHSGYGDLDVPCLAGVHYPKPASRFDMVREIESLF